MKETFGSAEPTPVGGLARSSRHGKSSKTTASIRATTRMADTLGSSMASTRRTVASRVSRLGPCLDPRNHRPGVTGKRLRRGRGWSELYWAHADHSALLDRYEGTVEEAGIQYVRRNEDAPCYSW